MGDRLETGVAWNPCTAGAIVGVIRRGKRRRNAAFALQLAGGAAMGVLMGFLVTGLVGLNSSNRLAEYSYGGVTCSVVRAQAADYLAGRVNEGLRRRIVDHLKRCPNCRPFIRRLIVAPTMQQTGIDGLPVYLVAGQSP